MQVTVAQNFAVKYYSQYKVCAHDNHTLQVDVILRVSTYMNSALANRMRAPNPSDPFGPRLLIRCI